MAVYFHRTAFCCWLLANILFSMPVILYAGYMMMATAAFIFFSMASFSTIMNVPQCVFSIGTDSFETTYSHSFWLALATGKDEKLRIHLLFWTLNRQTKPAEQHRLSTNWKWFPGVLCTIIGILVVMFNCMIPEKMKEAFSVGVDSYEDEDDSYGEGYLNTVFLDGVTISPLTSKEVLSVSWWHWEVTHHSSNILLLVNGLVIRLQAALIHSFIVLLWMCWETWLWYTFIVAKYIFSCTLRHL